LCHCEIKRILQRVYKTLRELRIEMNSIMSIDFRDFKSQNHICSVGLKYNQPLGDVNNELKKVLQIKDSKYTIVNQFNQKIPLTYRIRCDVLLYLNIDNTPIEQL